MSDLPRVGNYKPASRSREPRCVLRDGKKEAAGERIPAKDALYEKDGRCSRRLMIIGRSDARKARRKRGYRYRLIVVIGIGICCRLERKRKQHDFVSNLSNSYVITKTDATLIRDEDPGRNCSSRDKFVHATCWLRIQYKHRHILYTFASTFLTCNAHSAIGHESAERSTGSISGKR